MHNKQTNKDPALLIAFASNRPEDLDAVPTRNASNPEQPVQPWVKAPAALDDPPGCAPFQGTPGGESEQATNPRKYMYCPTSRQARLVNSAATTASKLSPECGASTTGATMRLSPAALNHPTVATRALNFTTT